MGTPKRQKCARCGSSKVIANLFGEPLCFTHGKERMWSDAAPAASANIEDLL